MVPIEMHFQTHPCHADTCQCVDVLWKIPAVRALASLWATRLVNYQAKILQIGYIMPKNPKKHGGLSGLLHKNSSQIARGSPWIPWLSNPSRLPRRRLEGITGIARAPAAWSTRWLG